MPEGSQLAGVPTGYCVPTEVCARSPATMRALPWRLGGASEGPWTLGTPANGTPMRAAEAPAPVPSTTVTPMPRTTSDRLTRVLRAVAEGRDAARM